MFVSSAPKETTALCSTLSTFNSARRRIISIKVFSGGCDGISKYTEVDLNAAVSPQSSSPRRLVLLHRQKLPEDAGAETPRRSSSRFLDFRRSSNKHKLRRGSLSFLRVAAVVAAAGAYRGGFTQERRRLKC